METMRKPFQGVVNIVRFNWHFYVLAALFILVLILMAGQFENPFRNLIYGFAVLVFAASSFSLLASYYVYDCSGLYRLDWIGTTGNEKTILNINAGFDETSAILQSKFGTAELFALDFYNPENHTEISIERARKAYPPFAGTKLVKTTDLNFDSDFADIIIVIFSAHEIRNETERIQFFKEMNRVLKPTGKIYVTEHLRDIPNFLAYTIGCFHFYSKASWLQIFCKANLNLVNETKLNPFVSNFTLQKHGNTL